MGTAPSTYSPLRCLAGLPAPVAGANLRERQPVSPVKPAFMGIFPVKPLFAHSNDATFEGNFDVCIRFIAPIGTVVQWIE